MQIDPSKIKWDTTATAPVIDPSKISWDTAPVEQQPQATAPAADQSSTLQRLAAPYASALDSTIGAAIPFVAGQVTYPLVRAVSSPETAAKVSKWATESTDRPFGKALGVTDTAEYKGEATQRALGAIGSVIESGVNRLARSSGVPASDISNMLGSASLAAPMAGRAISRSAPGQALYQGVGAVAESAPVQAAGQALSRGVGAVAESAPVQAAGQALSTVKGAMDARSLAKRQAASDIAYSRGAQIDAAKEAQRLGVVIDLRDMDPSSTHAKVMSALAGSKKIGELQRTNIGAVRQVTLDDLGLPKEADLAKGETFDTMRANVAAPYQQIARLPRVVADEATIGQIKGLMPEGHLIGKEAREAAIGRVVDSADRLMTEGLTGPQILDNVANLRKEARKVYDAKSPDLAALDAADTKLAIANILEGVIEKNISDPALLKEFRAARTEMAKSYAYEGAVNKNTGLVDVNRIAKITAKGGSYTGKLKSLGEIAGNFPYAFTTDPTVGSLSGMSGGTLSRSTFGGALLGTAGYAVGGYGLAVPMSLAGGAADVLQQAITARRIASPAYQKKQFIPDARIRVPDTPPAQNLGPTVPIGREVVPYVIRNPEVVEAKNNYRPNWVPGGNPPVRPYRPGAPSNALPAPSAEGTMNMLRTEDARQAAVTEGIRQDRRTAEGARRRAEDARIAAEEAARPRAPASREVLLEIDPITGRLRQMSAGIKGATLDIVRDTGHSLKGASEKVQSRMQFAMTAEERVAWDKTRVGINVADPGLRSLPDKEVRRRMDDRNWVEGIIDKARKKEAAFAEIAARAEQAAQSRRASMAAKEKAEWDRRRAEEERTKLSNLLDALESRYRAPRPESSSAQGQKTRAHQKNALAEAQAKNNALR